MALADPEHPVKSETRIEGWRTVDGIRLPSRTVKYRNGTIKVAEITVEETQLNRGIDPHDLAMKPANLLPEMSRHQ